MPALDHRRSAEHALKPGDHVSLTLGAGATIAGLVGLLFLASSCNKAPPEEDAAAPVPSPSEHNPQISLEEVQEQVVGKTINSTARLTFDENRLAHVFSPVTGRVTQIIAQLGQVVHKGQPLAIITSPDLGSAMSDVDKAKPAVIQAEKELKREKELFAVHADTQQNLEAAQASYDQAVAEVQRASEKVRLLMAQAHTDKVSQTFPLLSPIDGEIVARQINPGMEVQGQYSGGATQELYTIGRTDSIWVLADVFEQDLSRVKIGTPVDVTTVSYPDKVFKGKIDWISGTLDPVMRTVTVRCTLDNTDRLLKPQMYATVSIQTDGRKALAIPRSAILHLGDKQMVIAVNEKAPGGGKYERVPVILDEDEAGDWVPVLHGLDAGTKIVREGALILSEALN